MIDRLDHLVLTVADAARTTDFYVRGLGMRMETFGIGRRALVFGRQKLNLHEAEGAPILPRAAQPAPGSADLCFIAARPLASMAAHLKPRGLRDRARPGAADRRRRTDPSLYLRDPDGNSWRCPNMRDLGLPAAQGRSPASASWSLAISSRRPSVRGCSATSALMSSRWSRRAQATRCGNGVRATRASPLGGPCTAATSAASRST